MKKNNTPPTDGTSTVTPQRQLWNMLPGQYHRPMAEVFDHLKKASQEDIALGLIAYVRFGIKRSFANPFLKAVFDHLIYILDEY